MICRHCKSLNPEVDMHKVTVIVPVYNAEQCIERCVRSLFEQTLSDIEYIFVDDCTPDKSMEVLERVLKEYPERAESTVIIRHEKNTGQSGARRDGIKAATGEYLIHCDADDWVDTDMYESMYNKAKEDGVEAVCCDIVLEFDNQSVTLSVTDEYDDHQMMYDCKAPISVEYFSMCNRLVSREVFERNTILPFEGVNMWDDVGLATRVRYYVRSTSAINRGFYHYNRQNEQSTTRRPLLDRAREQELCIKCIEDFFRKENDYDRYRLFLSYLRLAAAEDLFYYEPDAWREKFASLKDDLWCLRDRYASKQLFKFYTLGCGGIIGKLIWKMFWKR